MIPLQAGQISLSNDGSVRISSPYWRERLGENLPEASFGSSNGVCDNVSDCTNSTNTSSCLNYDRCDGSVNKNSCMLDSDGPVPP